MYGEILDLCESGKDYSVQWRILFDQTILDGKKSLTLKNVINNAKTLGFNIIVACFQDSNYDEININEFLKKSNYNIEIDFFDFVRQIIDNQGYLRIEESIKNDNTIGKISSITYINN